MASCPNGFALIETEVEGVCSSNACPDDSTQKMYWYEDVLVCENKNTGSNLRVRTGEGYYGGMCC